MKVIERKFDGILLLALTILLTSCGPKQPPLTEGPNFLLIISDDQRYDLMDYMPMTSELVFDQGVTFDKAYITTSRCCPSRSAILTGQYNHNNGVYTNSSSLTKPTFVKLMYDAGYYTGIVGKYLNSYPTASDPPKPEFSFWNTFVSEDTSYFDPILNINGENQQFTGYQENILRDRALEFFQEADASGRPFMLIFTPRTPHLPAIPAKEDESLYPNVPPYRPPSFNPEDMTGKPLFLASQPMLTEEQINAIDQRWLDTLRSFITQPDGRGFG